MLLYIQRIKELYDSETFSKADRVIADYLLENPVRISDLSVNYLSQKTKISPATIVRFCKKLGFKGLSDMKMNAVGSYSESMGELMQLCPDDDAKAVKTKVCNFTKYAIDQLESTLDPDVLQETAQLISDASRVILMGEGGSGTICAVAYNIFMKLAIPCSYVTDPYHQILAIEMMSKSDLLIFLTSSGRPISLIQSAKLAKERGVKTIGIVAYSDSPLSAYLDVELCRGVFSDLYHHSDLAASRICELVTISILYSIVGLAAPQEQHMMGDKIIKALDCKRIPLKGKKLELTTSGKNNPVEQ